MQSQTAAENPRGGQMWVPKGLTDTQNPTISLRPEQSGDHDAHYTDEDTGAQVEGKTQRDLALRPALDSPAGRARPRCFRRVKPASNQLTTLSYAHVTGTGLGTWQETRQV